MYSDGQLTEMEEMSKRYIKCLNAGKTERECVDLTLEIAEKNGYLNLDTLIKEGRRLNAGDKVYRVNMNKEVILFHIGTEPLENGMNILGAHIDSPRIDVKQNPLYEDSEIAYLDTHYYGGIKKYQWVTHPMAIHGVVVRKDGTAVKISIGEKEDEPAFVISDLLIHLSQEQLEKKAATVIEGEGLDLLVGTRPDKENEKEGDAVRNAVLNILSESYGITEEDFISAELEIVPAGHARECGFDRSLILGYGQDDRVCAFTSLFAMLEVEAPSRTGCCILVDKEEIGSVGATGMQSDFFEDTVAEVCELTGGGFIHTKRTLRNSYMLSSDVSAAFDPLYSNAFEKKNTAFLGKGPSINKYTGSRGKNLSNDANAEYIGRIRNVFEQNDVQFQTAEMGRVDLGGGGTIAYIMANYGMNVIDTGVALLSMHAPYELVSKVDLYEAYRGYKAFLKDMK